MIRSSPVDYFVRDVVAGVVASPFTSTSTKLHGRPSQTRIEAEIAEGEQEREKWTERREIETEKELDEEKRRVE